MYQQLSLKNKQTSRIANLHGFWILCIVKDHSDPEVIKNIMFLLVFQFYFLK